MNIIKWLLMPKIKRLKYTMKICYKNRQALHFAGFRFDFDTMTIEKENEDGNN
jgi:hypothetical protein